MAQLLLGGERAGLRISLFGIGYVGTVSAACLARDGHSVIAVDTNPQKVEALNRGCAPIVEPRLDALIRDGVASGRLRASTKAQVAVKETDLSIVCVGTPSAPDGSLDVSAVERVAEVIGAVLPEKPSFHAVAVRSTLPVGSITRRILPVIERASGLKAGGGFGLACYPEFLREGSAIRDYDDPCHDRHGRVGRRDVSAASGVAAAGAPRSPPFVSFEEAEAVKSVSNALARLQSRVRQRDRRQFWMLRGSTAIG